MSVNSVSSSSAQNAALQALTKLETSEAGPDHDGDADDSGVKAPAPAPVQSTVNTSGQTIGTTISTKA